MNSFEKMLDFLNKLEQAKIYFKLDKIRPDTILVEIAVPGSRWEVEFYPNGETEIEIFNSKGDVKGDQESEKLLIELFKNYSD